jgi:hypothetical protein
MRSLVVTLVILLVIGILSLPLAVSGFAAGSAVEGLAGAALAIGCAYGVYLSAAQLVRHVPYASLDEHGFSCAAGSIAWSDVTEVSTYLRYGANQGNKRMLRFAFEPGIDIAPPQRVFLDSRFFGRPELRPTSLVAPAWTNKREALAEVRRFYDGPVED